MNPEFERNVWLELTPLRMVVMAAVLMLAFFTAALAQGALDGPGGVARWGFYIIVVIWGTRNAARSVVGEIRERTWDGQRLSSLGAGTMVWGKLFGSTVFNWYGGAICLVVILAETVERNGVLPGLIGLCYFIALGIIAQAASLLASLIAAGRRQGRTSFEVFFYQLVGIVSAIAVWAIADPAGPSVGGLTHTGTILWWGVDLDTSLFLLASLAVFAGWTLTGCYRQMRLELKLRNGPLVWLAFLAFMIVYTSGFDGFMTAAGHFDVVTRRLFLATATAAVLGYAMVLLEPKDRVALRWLGAEFGAFRLASALSHLQGWMTCWLAALAFGGAFLVRLGVLNYGADLATAAAALGFFTRDLGIVVMINMMARRRGGDIIAVAIGVLLYGLLPSILSGLHYGTGQALFLPRVTDPLWLSPAAAWIEAVGVWVATVSTIRLPDVPAGNT